MLNAKGLKWPLLSVVDMLMKVSLAFVSIRYFSFRAAAILTGLVPYVFATIDNDNASHVVAQTAQVIVTMMSDTQKNITALNTKIASFQEEQTSLQLLKTQNQQTLQHFQTQLKVAQANNQQIAEKYKAQISALQAIEAAKTVFKTSQEALVEANNQKQKCDSDILLMNIALKKISEELGEHVNNPYANPSATQDLINQMNSLQQQLNGKMSEQANFNKEVPVAIQKFNDASVALAKAQAYATQFSRDLPTQLEASTKELQDLSAKISEVTTIIEKNDTDLLVINEKLAQDTVQQVALMQSLASAQNQLAKANALQAAVEIAQTNNQQQSSNLSGDATDQQAIPVPQPSSQSSNLSGDATDQQAIPVPPASSPIAPVMTPLPILPPAPDVLPTQIIAQNNVPTTAIVPVQPVVEHSPVFERKITTPTCPVIIPTLTESDNDTQSLSVLENTTIVLPCGFEFSNEACEVKHKVIVPPAPPPVVLLPAPHAPQPAPVVNVPEPYIPKALIVMNIMPAVAINPPAPSSDLERAQVLAARLAAKINHQPYKRAP